MVDDNFWKLKYQFLWKVASTKEEKVKGIIEKECQCTCEFTGLGAGKTKFLAGSAKSRGYEKGGADLHVENSNIYIEVTGPNVDYVEKDKALWLRPDKIESAINHPENDHWVAHVLKKDFYMRAIHIDDAFKNAYLSKKLKIVHPTIRGVEETYVEIPATSEHVSNIEVLFESIKNSEKTEDLN